MSKVLYGNKKTGLCRDKNIQAQKHLPVPHKYQMAAPLAWLGRLNAYKMPKYIRYLIQNSKRKYSVLCLSCVTYCPIFETKARINGLIPFGAKSRQN